MQLITAFIFCYFGQRVTTKASKLTYAGYSSLWYYAPVRALRGIRLLMFYGQQDIHFSGYGIIICSMGTFQQILQKVAAVYLIFSKGYKDE